MTERHETELVPDMPAEQNAPNNLRSFLSPEQFARESGYRMALAVMGKSLRENMLTRSEYRQIKQILADYFSPIWGNLTDVLSK